MVSRTELVEHLYDQDFDRDSNTIEVFVGRLRKKLDSNLIQTVRGLGYCLEDSRRRSTKIAPKLNSLAGRLIAAAAVWTLLGPCGRRLSAVRRVPRFRAGDFDARLKFDLDGMIAAAEPDAQGDVSLRGRFADPRFERVYSGWYWQITPVGAKGAPIPAMRRFRARCSTARSRSPIRRTRGAA